jgi:hypothetical protein
LLFRSANLSDIQVLFRADKLELVKASVIGAFEQILMTPAAAKTQYADSGLLSQIGEALPERRYTLCAD